MKEFDTQLNYEICSPLIINTLSFSELKNGQNKHNKQYRRKIQVGNWNAATKFSGEIWDQV